MQYLIAFLEGIITFLSPCLLPMLPIYITYFAGGGTRTTKKTLLCAFGFVCGFTAVFVAMGRVPDCSLIAAYAELDAVGCASSGEDCRTKTPGLYVAGDCRSKHIRQLTTAVADGTVAATAACEYLDSLL